MNRDESLLKSAWLIAFVILISKFVGFLRDILIANFYGAGLVSDAYFYAYQIPAVAIIIMGGVGGPFHSATVSVFAKLINKDDKLPSEKVNKLFNTFLSVTFIVFLILSILLFCFSKEILNFIIHTSNTELLNLASLHLKIMSPVVLIGGIIGIYYGLLITYKSFLLPNISPALMSLTIIIVMFLSKGDKIGICLAIATSIGALVQFIVQFPAVKKIGFKIKPNFDIKNNPEYKNIMELLFPAILSSTVGQIYVYVDMFFASQLREGAWSALGYSNRIFQFPVGILSTAFLVPLFPLFAKLVGEKKYDDIKYYFHKGMGLLSFVAIPVMFCLLLFGYDVIKLVFERGRFNPSDTFLVFQALSFLSFSIIPYVFRDCITRIYYAFNDSKVPFITAFFCIIFKFILNSLFIDKLGISAITLSTTGCTMLNAIILAILLRRKIKLEYKIYFINITKMLFAAALACFVNIAVYNCWTVTSFSWFVLLLRIILLFILYLVSYCIFALILRIEFVGELFARIRNYIKQKFVR